MVVWEEFGLEDLSDPLEMRAGQEERLGQVVCYRTRDKTERFRESEGEVKSAVSLPSCLPGACYRFFIHQPILKSTALSMSKLKDAYAEFTETKIQRKNVNFWPNMCISHFCQGTCWQRVKCLLDMVPGLVPSSTSPHLVWHHGLKILHAHRANAWYFHTNLLVVTSKGLSSFQKISCTFAKPSMV